MGSSGGGSSGAVSYPSYIYTPHAQWINDDGSDTLTADSMMTLINDNQGNSPWVSHGPYDPDTDITAMESAITVFSGILAGIVDTTNWASFFTQAETSVGEISDITNVPDADINDAVDAFSDQRSDELTAKVLPRFQGGMRNINAVQSSAFVIGEAVIEAFNDRDVASYSANLRMKAMDISVQLKQLHINASNQMLNLMLNRINWQDMLMKTTIEQKRMKIIAKVEENEIDMEIDHKDAMWDFDLFQHGANLMGGPAGGTVVPGSGSKTSKTSSAIGGALSGAAAGATIGAPTGIGAPVGATIGGVLGAAQAFL